MDSKYTDRLYSDDRGLEEAPPARRRPAPGKVAMSSRLGSSLGGLREPAETPTGSVSRDAAGGEIAPQASAAVQAASSSPSGTLPQGLSRDLGASLGVGYMSGVRVHTGSESAAAAKALSANAFTVGQDIHFGAGKYDPDSQRGQQLIAHEVAHTVQQRGAASTGPQTQLTVSAPGDAHEQQAEAFAQSFVRGEAGSVTPVTVGGVARQVISRVPGDPEPAPANAPAGGGGATYTPDAGTFQPVITKDPDQQIKLFENWIHSFQVSNASDAPANTQYQWGNGIDGSGTLEYVGSDTQDGGQQCNVWVIGRKPGQGRVQATLLHRVPGGPQARSPTQHAGVTVLQPTVSLRSIHSVPNMDGRLVVGDTFHAMIDVGNVDGEQMPDHQTVISLAGTGSDKVRKTACTVVESGPTSKTFDFTFEATGVGQLAFQLQPDLGSGVPLGGGPTATIDGLDIEMDRQEFINFANQCDTKIARAYTRADTIMEKLSAAYGDAWDAHVRTLEAQDASNRLVGEMILGAALAFIPGGVGGVVGTFMKNAKVGDFLADAVKDMAKAGVKGVQGALASGGGGGSVMRPMSDNPRTWRASYVERVNSEKEHVLDILDDWKTKANTRDPNFRMNFNPVTVTESSLVRNGTPLKDVAVPDQGETAKQFELGFWRDWLTNYGYTVTASPTYMGVHYSATENQGKKIRDRINALGEDGESWLSTYGGIARRRAEAEAERRNDARYGMGGTTVGDSVSRGLAAASATANGPAANAGGDAGSGVGSGVQS